MDGFFHRPGRALAALALAAALGPAPAAAQPLAELVVDAPSGRVLHARDANRRLHPASIAKLMTVYLVLEALDAGTVRPDTGWTVSATAAGQPATRLGLAAGSTLTVAAALDAIVVASANDAAVVAAEGLAGTEAAFAARMTTRARALGMPRTVFRNASGLPDRAQLTTARDVAVLALALMRRFPGHAALFARTRFSRGGRTVTGHNDFLRAYRGATGMKTGFTCRAGFNLVASATRDGRTLVGVVLGARTRGQRASAMRRAMDAAFAADPAVGDLDSLPARADQGAALNPPGAAVAEDCRARGPAGWSIDMALGRTEAQARRLAARFIATRREALRGGRPLVIPRFTGVDLFRACVTGLREEQAREVCLAHRRDGGDCIIFGPEVARHLLDEAARVRELRRRAAKSGG